MQNRKGILVPTLIVQAAVGVAIVLFISILAAGVRALIEPYLLDVDHTELTVPDLRNGVKPLNLNSSSEKKALLRIAFFSDLHGKGCKVPLEKLLGALFAEPSDLIVFGGDIADSSREAEDGLKLLRAIGQMAAQRGIPCYAIRGNHDRKVSGEAIESTGFRPLINEQTELTGPGASGARFLLIGLDDSGKKRRIWPDLPGRLPTDIPKEQIILLVHNPDFILSQGGSPGFGMMLSGHFHGGQVVLPFRLHSVLRGDQLPRQGISQGLFSKNGVNGYITRGVGCVTLPIRFLAKPQVSHLTLVG
jgi:hypothetical protein